MQSFVYEALPARVVFGSGTVAQLRAEAERLGVRRILVLSTPGRGEAQARDVAALLGDLAVGVHAGAVMHTPVEATETALQVVRKLGADAVVAVGGGSTTGLGKAIALRTDLPQIVLPTTYAGSEMTPILGETKDGVKTTQRTPKVLPEVVIYDVDLTLGLPAAIAATSGMNAMAHAVEALYARDRNPVTSLMAEEGIRSLAQALPGIADDPQDRAARRDALYGAWLCGTCLGLGRHGAAPQALSRSRRDLRPAARRDPRHRPAARRRLQRIGRTGGHEPHCTGHRRGECRARPVRAGQAPRDEAGAARHRHAGERDRAGRQSGNGGSLLEPASTG